VAPISRPAPYDQTGDHLVAEVHDGVPARLGRLGRGRNHMSELIVIGFDNPGQASAAYDEALALQADFIVGGLRGVAVVTVDAEGKIRVETPQKVVGMGAVSGALWGLLIGLLFFVPVFGAALGGAMGAVFGKLAKSGIDDTFRSQVKDLLQPRSAAVVLMADEITQDKFAERMSPYGGRLLKTSLSEQDEKDLAHDLGGQQNES
jgi:uncharacterized membrane protein